MSYSDLNVINQNNIYNFNVSFRVPILYEEVGGNVVISNFDCTENEDDDVELYNTSAWNLDEKIYIFSVEKELEREKDYAITANYSGNEPLLNKLNYNVEYLKFRVNSITTTRGKLYYNDSGLEIPAIKLPVFNPEPIDISFSFENDNIVDNRNYFTVLTYSDIGGIINNNKQTNDDPEHYTVKNIPSEWVYFDKGVNPLNFDFLIDILHYKPGPLIENLKVFLSQRLISISFILEFEFKIIPNETNIINENVINQEINMPNLYKMIETFLKQRPESIKLSKADGINNSILKDLEKDKSKKRDRVKLYDKFTEEEIEYFVNKIITGMRKL